MVDDEDRALLVAFLSGEDAAFNAMVRRHGPEMLATAKRRLGSRVEAEDAVQDAFERALRGMPALAVSDKCRLAPWLHRIVVNVCHDRLSRRASWQRLTERLADNNLMVEVPASDERGFDPVVDRKLRAAVAALPESQRDALVLHDLIGLPYQELAVHTGTTEENVRARVHRARRNVRGRLAGVLGVASATVAAAARLVTKRNTPHAANTAVSSGGGGEILVRGGIAAFTAVVGVAAMITTSASHPKAPGPALVAPPGRSEPSPSRLAASTSTDPGQTQRPLARPTQPPATGPNVDRLAASARRDVAGKTTTAVAPGTVVMQQLPAAPVDNSVQGLVPTAAASVPPVVQHLLSPKG